jgi:hypothetical protein
MSAEFFRIERRTIHITSEAHRAGQLKGDHREEQNRIRNYWSCARRRDRIDGVFLEWLCSGGSEGEGEYLNETNVRPNTELPQSITLWRGAIAKHRRGLSWTDDRDRATWFAGRFNGTLAKTAHLYRLDVTPEMVLARFSKRGESEWVLSPEALDEAEPVKEMTPVAE